MVVEIDSPWQVASALMGFLGLLAAAGKVLLAQIDKRLDLQFKAIEDQHATDSQHWGDLLAASTEHAHRNAENLLNLERTFLRWQAELPLQYVRREDYVRGQSVIEAKLDALYSKLEVAQMKGGKNG